MTDFAIAAAVLTAGAFFGALGFFTPIWGPRLIFHRLESRTKNSSRLPAFSISDLLVLLGLLSPVNAIASLMRNQVPVSWLAMLMLGANAIVVLTWVLGLRLMEKFRVRRPASRVLFQLVIHPLAIFAPPGVFVGGITSVETLFAADLSAGPLVAASLLVTTVSLALCVLARRGCARLLDAEGLAHASTLPSRREVPDIPINVD